MALVAYATLLYRKARFKKQARKNIIDVKPTASQDLRQPNPKSAAKSQEYLDHKLADLDHKYLLIFPCVFLLFNLTYWPFVATGRLKQDQ